MPTGTSPLVELIAVAVAVYTVGAIIAVILCLTRWKDR